MITLDSVIQAALHHVSCALPEGTAILDLRTGVYYALDPVGARIWELIERPTAAAEVLDHLTREYAVPRERCGEDLLRLLEDLAKNGLIDVRGPRGADH